MKLSKPITIDEIKVRNISVLDEEKPIGEKSIMISLYNQNKEVGSVLGYVVPKDARLGIPSFDIVLNAY